MLASEKRAKVREGTDDDEAAKQSFDCCIKGKQANCLCPRQAASRRRVALYLPLPRSSLDQVITAVRPYALNRHMATCTEQRVSNQWAGPGSEILTFSTKNCVPHNLFLIS